MSSKRCVSLSFLKSGLAVTILVLCVVFLSGCSSSGDGGGAGVASTGVFVDSPVAGLDYSTKSLAGVTDAEGRFRYHRGQEVSFSIGDLPLGSAPGSALLTPLNITQGALSAADRIVNNKLILLQTLDADGDLNNGIQLTDAIREIVSDHAENIDFDQDPADFRTSLTGLITELNDAGVFTDADPRPRTPRTAVAALEHFTRSTSERIVVNTIYGQLRGYEANGTTWQFLGVPYARPPVGDLRWRPPQEPDSWTGIRDAIAWSDQAAQGQVYQQFGEGGMSENCLYLNITAPKNAQNLPVMVWFHGGGYQILTANTKGYNTPDSLTTKGVILVTVNQRLNVFGYLAHPELTAESGYGGSGNYGNMDLIAALEWIQSNIEAFGGDPNNVTIFGQSGGGRKVLSLRSTPLASGLFHKAICQSGSLRPDTRSLEDAENMGLALQAGLGVSSLAEMRAKTWMDIVAAYSSTVPDPYPNVDNWYFPGTERGIIESGSQNDTPFMILVTMSDNTEPIATVKNYLPWMADNTENNVFASVFTKVPSGWADRGVLPYHSVELSYVFNTPASAVVHYLLGLVIDPSTGVKLAIGDLNGNGVTGTQGDQVDILMSIDWDAQDVNTADTIMTMWTNFAKTGDPSTADFIWPQYTSANDSYVDLGLLPVAKTGLSTVLP